MFIPLKNTNKLSKVNGELSNSISLKQKIES